MPADDCAVVEQMASTDPAAAAPEPLAKEVAASDATAPADSFCSSNEGVCSKSGAEPTEADASAASGAEAAADPTPPAAEAVEAASPSQSSGYSPESVSPGSEDASFKKRRGSRDSDESVVDEGLPDELLLSATRTQSSLSESTESEECEAAVARVVSAAASAATGATATPPPPSVEAVADLDALVGQLGADELRAVVARMAAMSRGLRRCAEASALTQLALRNVPRSPEHRGAATPSIYTVAAPPDRLTPLYALIEEGAGGPAAAAAEEDAAARRRRDSLVRRAQEAAAAEAEDGEGGSVSSLSLSSADAGPSASGKASASSSFSSASATAPTALVGTSSSSSSHSRQPSSSSAASVASPRLISSLDLRARRHRDASRNEPPRGRASPPLSSSSEEDGAPPDGRLRRPAAAAPQRPLASGGDAGARGDAAAVDDGLHLHVPRREPAGQLRHRRLRHAVP